ncbi:MAG: metal ABC transporter permease [Fusobacteriaceae bacterium]
MEIYNFITFALIAGIGIAISCGILGPFLVIKNHSLIGDGLSHVAFLALAIGMLLGNTSIFIIILVEAVAALLILNVESKKISGDSAIGMISSFSLALGIIIASVNRGFSSDIFSFLFGSILFIEKSEVILSVLWALFLIIFISFFYNQIFSITYDEEFSKIQEIDINFYKKLIGVFTGITIAIGIKILGTLLISALIVFPAVSAIEISKTFKGVTLYSIFFSILSVALGIGFSYLLNYPTGATIVLINAFIFFFVHLFKKIYF